MSLGVERVVVVVDAASRDSLSTIAWTIQGLPLKPGDMLLLVRVVHQVTNPMGYKSKVDSRSILGVNRKIVKEEVTKKEEELINNEELRQVSQQFETRKVDFQKKVLAGYSLRAVTVCAAKTFKATWVILDRHMKKDNKYVMEKLSCTISRIKSNNQVEKLRASKPGVNNRSPARRSRSHSRLSPVHVTYGEMVEGSAEEELSPRKPVIRQKNNNAKGLTEDGGRGDAEAESRLPNSSKAAFSKSSPSEHLTTTVSTSSLGYADASSSSYTESKPSVLHSGDQESSPNTERERGCNGSPLVVPDVLEDSVARDGKGKRTNDWMGGPDEVLKNSVCSICKNRRPKIGWTRDFTYAELQAATENFAPKNYLSEGGFGSVYRGEISGLKIAVKQHKSASFQGEKEFKNEVNVLSKARNDNLVMLLGSCSEGDHRLLVYEFVCNGSLDQHLSKHNRRPLTWEKRMKIAMGAARGLQYLHENNIIHRDMRPNNILVTHDFESLLGDFGLAKTQFEDSDNSSETRVVGTLGYLAPEYAECGKVSSKTDVYAFGVVLLQLITGLNTTDKLLGGRSLVGWARPLLKERYYPDLIDPRIVDSHDVHQLLCMVQVVEQCLRKDPQKRVPMDRVVLVLSSVMEGKSYIRDFSPAQSSPRSMPDAIDSQNDEDKSCTPSPTQTQ